MSLPSAKQRPVSQWPVGLCRSSALARACILAVGPAAAHLHPTDTQMRQEVVEKLLSLMASDTSTSVKAACAESLGLFVTSSTDSKKLSDADRGLAFRIAESLLRMLCTLCSAAVAPVKKMVQSLPDLLHMDCMLRVQADVTNEDEQAEAVFGIMAGKSRGASVTPTTLVLGQTTVLEQPMLQVMHYTH